MNFDLIKNRINTFKSRQNFEESEYIKILEDLDNLYNKKNNAFIQLTSNDYILKEKENFRKYLILNLLNNANKEAKAKNFGSALNNIKKLEALKPSEKETKEKDKIKEFCYINLNWIKGENLIKAGEYDKAINYFKQLKQTSTNVNQNDIYNKGIQEAKSIYMASFSKEIANLLPKKEENLSIEKYQIITNKCEQFFQKFQYDSLLKFKISEIKKKYYCFALENIIDKKIEMNVEFNNEMHKYKALIDTENIKENKLEDFKLKIENKNIIEINDFPIEKGNNTNNEFDEISLETIKIYLNIIKNINETNINENFENEIITQIINYNNELHTNHNDIKNWISSNSYNIKDNKFRGNVFAVFNLVNKNITGFNIRPIQLLSLLILTKNEPKLGGIFLQINTGEGKSLIIQFLSAYLALLGNKVDVISSSSILADRDAEDKNIKQFYSYLGLSSGCASKDEYSNNIVYGDTQNFEAGILREEFKEKEVRKNRPFDCVIIDEVDSISLDNIITMTQLTENFPGRSCFFYFYYQILICYCQIINELPEITGKTKEYFYENQNEFKEIIHAQIKKMFKGKILKDDGIHLEDNLPIIFPNCMKKNIEDSLDTWINNVIRAPSMLENRDFIIKKNIIPVDYSNTGVLQNNMVWDGGLQQILQIIHNTKGTFENENTNFLSNISFFRRYNGNIYGVTGTFGGSNFQYILKKVYKIDLFKIPPNKTSLLENMGCYVFPDEKSYIEKILVNIKTIVEQQKRSVLLICNSIAKGKEFYDILEKNYNVKKYFTEDDKETIEQVLDIGIIIVATNLTGRGTDIKISEQLEKNGGLHVLVSFLPINQRIEEQNYGRAGRKGQKGSHILIMKYNDEYGPLKEEELNVENIRKIRDQIELKSINSLMENEMKNILEKEKLFKDFCSFLKNSCKNCNNFQKSNIEEKWGILLKNKNINDIKSKYEEFKREDKDIIQNNLIKLKDIINNSDNLKEFFKKIFDLEPKYSWAAKIRYCCMLSKETPGSFYNKYSKQNEAIEEFQKVKEIINIFIEDLSSQSSLNKLTFSFFEKNKEKIKENNFKTEIELQNDNRKNFLEIIKKLIDDNIEVIQQFINENKPDNKIEIDKLLAIEDIIKITTNISLDYKSDIKAYMNEFGFTTFEVLIIKKQKNYIGNLIVITLGIVELCIGTVLLAYSANPMIFQIARAFIREGIKDLIKGVSACIKGEEIDLKTYGIEKVVSLVGFALELAVGASPSIGNTFNERLISIVKGEVIYLTKNYANSLVANKIVKKLIKKMSEKIKYWLIEPLMNMINLNGENIDKYIQYDLLNDSDTYKNALLEQCENLFTQMDYLIDFIGPIIEVSKLVHGTQKGEKMVKFLEYMSNFDYKGLIEFTKTIYNSIQNTKVENKLDNSLSILIKNSGNSYTEEEVDCICKELIECGVINKKGEFNSKYIQIKDFKQYFLLKIDEKYMKYEFDDKKHISKDLEKKLDFLALKVSNLTVENKKNEIKEEIYDKLENFMQSLIERILEILEDKVSEQFEKLWKKYQENKKLQKMENEIDEDDIEGNDKKKKSKENDLEEEENDVKIAKKANSNQVNENEENLVLPELNQEEIENSKIKKNEDKDDDFSTNENSKKKNLKEEEDDNISSIQDKKEENENDKKEIKKEKEEKKKEKEERKKEKIESLMKENKIEVFCKEVCKFGIEYGTKEGINSLVVPKIIEILGNWFKDILKERLLPKLLDRFDKSFEKLGAHIIILQERYKIKDYTEIILNKVRICFHIITSIKVFLIPPIKNVINEIKKGVNVQAAISKLYNELMIKGKTEVLIPIKDFVDKIFGKEENMEKSQFLEKIIEEGYSKVSEIGIEKYEKFKSLIYEKKENYKKMYLDKRKEICDFPDELAKKYEKEKKDLKEKYDKLKKNIISSSDEQIKKLKKMNIRKEFNKIVKNLEKYVHEKLDGIKQKVEEEIGNISLIIPNYLEKFIAFIDKIINLNFGKFDEHKIDISEQILNFIIEVESGNIELEKKNEQGEITEENAKELLIKYLNEKLEIDAKNITQIIEHLFKNGLNLILIKKINSAIDLGQKYFEKIKTYYEPKMKLIKGYFETFKEGAVSLMNDYKNAVNKNIDIFFEHSFELISYFFQKANVLDLYLKNLNNIIISKNFKNDLLETIKLLRDKAISKISKEFEEKMKELESKIDEKINEFKEKSKSKINELVDEYEDKFFGKINDIIKDDDFDKEDQNGNNKENEDKKKGESEKEEKKEKEEGEEEEEEEEKKEKEEKEKKGEKEKINKENKNESNNKKKKKKKKKALEFDKFNKYVDKLGKKANKKICENTSKLEEKFKNYAKNSNARKYLKKKFSGQINKKSFDEYFEYIEKIQKNGEEFLESDKVKEKCQKLDKYLTKFANSDKTQKVINCFDKLNVKLTKKVLDEIDKITPLLSPESEEKFKDGFKKLLQDEIMLCYDAFLPELKGFVKGICQKAIDQIYNLVNKKSKKK